MRLYSIKKRNLGRVGSSFGKLNYLIIFSLSFYRKTIEKVIYFMLLERKERSPTREDATVAAIKNIREICKFLVCHYLSLLLILLQIKLTFARKILHLPVASF